MRILILALLFSNINSDNNGIVKRYLLEIESCRNIKYFVTKN